MQREEFPHRKFHSIHLKGIGAHSKDRREILKDFDQKVPGRVYILASCKTLGEGIDTRYANMECPLHPSQSNRTNAQQLGRITRKPEEKMPKSVLVLPCCVDAISYNDADTPEQKNALLMKHINESGDFQALLNTIIAYRHQYDE